MTFSDFTLESVETSFGLTTRSADLFPGCASIPTPSWLTDIIARGRAVAVPVSEKARSEFIVSPILLACRELFVGELAIFSGQRLDVDAAAGLSGECDYILALTNPVPRLKAPLVVILEAERGELEAGLGQCVAQMLAAQKFNEKAGKPLDAIFGAVTTGEAWQFLRLAGTEVTLHDRRLFIDDLPAILAALRACLPR